MELLILPDAHEVGRAAAAYLAEVVRQKPAAVLGLATGSSPMNTYIELAEMVARGGLDFTSSTAFALDEYVGLPATHPESYRSVIDRDVTVPLRMDPARVHVLDGRARDLDAACASFENRMRASGGVDVQILGIGTNGHIGFNEPGSSADSRTRVASLTPITRHDNARFFGSIEDVPTHCVTQGIGTILEARQIILVAQGGGKATPLARALEGPVSPDCPASVLQLHPHVTWIIDEASAQALRSFDRHRVHPAPLRSEPIDTSTTTPATKRGSHERSLSNRIP